MNGTDEQANESRRDFLRKSFLSIGFLAASGHLVACGGDESSGGELGEDPPLPVGSNLAALTGLGAPDANGVRLHPGFTSRILAVSGQPVGPSGMEWPEFPDGGATFATRDGGFYYAVNTEGILTGGVSSMRFDREGNLVDVFPILTDSIRNCSGGKMPWGTWMTCEEVARGRVIECDPTGKRDPVIWELLGRFPHEAVAYDPANHHLYLTEDLPDGRFYRFRPDGLVDGHADFSSGTLEVLRVLSGTEGACEWLPVADPSGSPVTTREQQPTSTAFTGGEGIYVHDGIVFFTTKGDNRIWGYTIATSELTIVYDDAGTLRGVDNLIASPFGELVVAEDGDDMEIVARMPGGSLVTLCQVVGHDGSEITGIAFDPGYTRLLFGSQRGTDGNGVSFMVEGPFFRFA